MTGTITIGLSQINNSFSGANYLPYATGLLQCYLETHHPAPSRLRFLEPLFRRIPVDEAVDQFRHADVVGFSLYVWNLKLSLAIMKRLKELRPDMLVVVGGPQVPDRSEAFLRSNPFIDVAVNGEGEEIFNQLISLYPSRDWVGVPGTSFITADGTFVSTPKPPRIRDLSKVPSPYLAGTFAPLMAKMPDSEWLVLWETNRGCPFQCTYCDWGSAVAAKVVQQDMDRLKQEMDWFSDNRIEFIFCCDANFGILPRDVDLARHAADNKQRTGYPKALSVQNTKNATERAYLTQKILADAGLNKGVTLSMQTMDPTALENVKRANISLDTYSELQKRFTEEGVVTYSDLILALPGETYDTFANAVSALIESGQHNRIQFNNLSVLPNAEMGDPLYQQKFGMQLVETEILNIHGSRDLAPGDIAETQDLVIATHSMPRDAWRKVRAFAWMAAFLHFDKLLQIPLVVMHETLGVSYREMFEQFMEAKADSYPLIASIARHFLDRAADIQQGGPEYAHSAEWLDIWWPDDEYIFIKLSVNGELEQFYQESGRLLASMVTDPAMIPILDDALALNRVLVKQPFVTDDVEITLSHNIVEFHGGILRGRPVELQMGRWAYRVVRSTENWPTWDKWCREVVWWGNKKGAYLYGSEALEKYYAGHY